HRSDYQQPASKPFAESTTNLELRAVKLELVRSGLHFAVAIGLLASAAISAQGTMPTGSGLVTGQVIDADGGAPVASAVVALTLSGTTGVAVRVQALTDARGRFFFRDVGAATYSVTATKPGWIPGAAGRRRAQGDAPPVVVRDGEVITDVS